MPWEAARRNRGWAVIKSKTGKVVAMHQSKAKAMAHVRALYANTKE